MAECELTRVTTCHLTRSLTAAVMPFVEQKVPPLIVCFLLKVMKSSLSRPPWVFPANRALLAEVYGLLDSSKTCINYNGAVKKL